MQIDILYLGKFERIPFIEDSFYIPYLNFIDTENQEVPLDIPTINLISSDIYSIRCDLNGKHSYIQCDNEKDYINSFAKILEEAPTRFPNNSDFLGLYDLSEVMTLTSDKIYKKNPQVQMNIKLITNTLSKKENIRSGTSLIYIIDNMKSTNIDIYKYIDDLTANLSPNSNVCIITDNYEEQERQIEQYSSQASFTLCDISD